MKVLFFNEPSGTEKLSFIVTDESASSLKERGVINKKSKTLVKEFEEPLNEDSKKMLSFVNFLEFDNYRNPKNVKLNLEMIKVFYLEEYRKIRNYMLEYLDKVQIRALSSNRTDIMEQVEKDKNDLRNMPIDIDFSRCETMTDVENVRPEAILVNHKEKYDNMFRM